MDSDGLSLALSGLIIVFSGLLLVSLYILIVPRVLGAFERRRQVSRPNPAAKGTGIASESDLDPALLAAVAYVIHAEIEHELAASYQRITIQRDESQRVWSVAGKMRTLSTRM